MVVFEFFYIKDAKQYAGTTVFLISAAL